MAVKKVKSSPSKPKGLKDSSHAGGKDTAGKSKARAKTHKAKLKSNEKKMDSKVSKVRAARKAAARGRAGAAGLAFSAGVATKAMLDKKAAEKKRKLDRVTGKAQPKKGGVGQAYADKTLGKKKEDPIKKAIKVSGTKKRVAPNAKKKKAK